MFEDASYQFWNSQGTMWEADMKERVSQMGLDGWELFAIQRVPWLDQEPNTRYGFVVTMRKPRLT